MKNTDAKKSASNTPQSKVKTMVDPKRAQALRANLLRRKAAARPKQGEGA
jgi:hypothetical protein